MTSPSPVSSWEAERERLRKALAFYADPSRYHGPNKRLEAPDEYTPADFSYRYDVTRDGGSIARAALSESKEQTTADGWIEWKGGDCPVATSESVEIKFRDGLQYRGPAGYLAWYWDEVPVTDIIAYRVVAP